MRPAPPAQPIQRAISTPIFIVACLRSGATLRGNLLRAHPDLVFPDESHFIPRFYKGYGNPRSETEARDLAAKILGLFWVRKWGLTLTPDDFAGCRSYREIVGQLFQA